MSYMYSLIRPFLFSLDPEKAHYLALKMLKFLPPQKTISLPVKALGLNFPHPIGLAAGFDKNGEYINTLTKLGFSFIEVGTVTPKPQIGNPKPRLFRIKEKKALINRMGFNNLGVNNLVQNIINSKYSGILGINIGKNKDTPNNNAIDDYKYCLKKVYPYASYITINISSPNTKELRELQKPDILLPFLQQIKIEQAKLEEKYQKYVPILIKLSPDEPDDILKQITNLIISNKFDGIIATNTTIEQNGGLSGEPLFLKSLHCIKLIKQEVDTNFTIIGCGGIDNIDKAKAVLAAGASLLQIYTGLIYKGPNLVYNITRGFL